jgi:glutamate-1-semialdehyde 2,1-aminomutase
MFGFFFAGEPVRSYEEAQQSDGERFIRFFNQLLEHGVYVAPSAFEAGFVSAAHTDAVIAETVDVMTTVLSAKRCVFVTTVPSLVSMRPAPDDPRRATMPTG